MKKCWNWSKAWVQHWRNSFYIFMINKMRPYKNFVQKRLGKRVDYDKQYDYQCTDLAKQYIDEVLDIKKTGIKKIWPLWNAKNMPNNPFFSSREKIKGTKNLMQGDVIIRSQWPYGHVAIVDHVLNWKVYVLEQNGSGRNSGSGIWANAIRIRPYRLDFYDTVLRCKKIFDNLVLEREFVAEKIEKLSKEWGQEAEIRNTKEYLATTRYQVN